MWKINAKQNKDVYMVALRDEGKLIGYYEKHEYRNTETMKQYDLWWWHDEGWMVQAVIWTTG